jgi:hypothetical protein
MAEGKKSILVYADWIHTFESLTDEEAGVLIKHFFRYVNDENPKTDNRIIQIAFEPIKQHLKRDLVKYQNIREKRSKSGLISADKKKQTPTHSTSVNKSQHKPTHSTSVNKSQHKPTHSTVNDNVNDNVNDIYKKEILNSQTWMEATAKNNSTSVENLKVSFEVFWNLHLYDSNHEHKNQSEIQKHFGNWLKTNKPKQIDLKPVDEVWGVKGLDYDEYNLIKNFDPSHEEELIQVGWVRYNENWMRKKLKP